MRAGEDNSFKHDGAEVYRTEMLDPPPLAGLAKGDAVRMIAKGPASSLIETGTGIKGWVRNDDLLAMANAPGQRHVLKDQHVTSDEVNISPWIQAPTPIRVTPDDLERSFQGEILEPMDREQVEMRHDEN